jgi:hypothetical protein
MTEEDNLIGQVIDGVTITGHGMAGYHGINRDGRARSVSMAKIRSATGFDGEGVEVKTIERHGSYTHPQAVSRKRW